MAETNQPICFQCGQANRTDRFNRLADGRQCPACTERLFATLPPLLPGASSIDEPELAVGSEPEFDGDMPAA